MEYDIKQKREHTVYPCSLTLLINSEVFQIHRHPSSGTPIYIMDYYIPLQTRVQEIVYSCQNNSPKESQVQITVN